MSDSRSSTIRIRVVEHKETGLLLAESSDMPGLMVAARSEEQLNREIPLAITELLEAEGCKVKSVSVKNDQSDDTGFVERSMVASALLEMHC